MRKKISKARPMVLPVLGACRAVAWVLGGAFVSSLWSITLRARDPPEVLPLLWGRAGDRVRQFALRQGAEVVPHGIAPQLGVAGPSLPENERRDPDWPNFDALPHREWIYLSPARS